MPLFAPVTNAILFAGTVGSSVSHGRSRHILLALRCNDSDPDSSPTRGIGPAEKKKPVPNASGTGFALKRIDQLLTALRHALIVVVQLTPQLRVVGRIRFQQIA